MIRCLHAAARSPRGLALVLVVVVAVALLSVLSVLSVLYLALPTGPAAADAGPWQWPLSPAPEVLRPAQLPAEVWQPGHRGVDLAAPVGSPVLAAGAGTVSFAGVVVDRGVVVVTHGALRTTYEPVDAAVGRGDVVGPGDPLGTLSAVPGHCAPRPCLHWGLRRGDTYVDPLLLVRAGHARLLPVWRSPPAGTGVAPPASTVLTDPGTAGSGLALGSAVQPPVLTAVGLAGLALRPAQLTPPRAPRLAGRT